MNCVEKFSTGSYLYFTATAASSQIHFSAICPFHLSFCHFFLSAHGFGCKYTVGPSEKPQSLCRNIGGEHHKQNYTLCLLYKFQTKQQLRTNLRVFSNYSIEQLNSSSKVQNEKILMTMQVNFRITVDLKKIMYILKIKEKYCIFVPKQGSGLQFSVLLCRWCTMCLLYLGSGCLRESLNLLQR